MASVELGVKLKETATTKTKMNVWNRMKWIECDWVIKNELKSDIEETTTAISVLEVATETHQHRQRAIFSQMIPWLGQKNNSFRQR